MSTASIRDHLVITVTGGNRLEPSPDLVGETVRGGGFGLLDLGVGDAWALQALGQCGRRSPGSFGVRVSAACTAGPAEAERAARGKLGLVVLTADASWSVAEAARRHRVLVEVTDLAEARAAVASGAHGLIARGMESGGRVSRLSAFVLLQQLLADESVVVPVWVAGGIGPRTAAAAVVGGAEGVVLDSQLLLLPETILADDVRALVRRMDGSETVLVDEVRGLPHGGSREAPDALLPIGQDGWLAADVARRWSGVAEAVRGIRRAITEAMTDRAAGGAFVEGSPLARALGTALPVAQGPMTRVSDEAGFADAVSAAGALPFIALSLASPEQSRRMLTDAAAALGDRPWGVGVLGFAPEELRDAQIQLIHEFRPSCVIIAGGRPALAKGLEQAGINTFLHVPSRALLRQYLEAGTRRFVFEGAECGGHIGPRASFPLWEVQLAVLDDFLNDRPDIAASEIQVFLAGGIHDERSAAMAATMVSPLRERGVQVGVLMGTAYLFTEEAVIHGAIQPLFQRRAIEATATTLLETAPGLVTRCLPSPFAEDFQGLRAGLAQAGVANRELWDQLEVLNVGRLRIASKGLLREGDQLVEVGEEVQATDGLFMAGQVAVLRESITTLAQLHAQVTAGAARFHAQRVGVLGDGLEVTKAGQDGAVAPVDIAIVGMACVFPGSPDLDSYWRTILSGADKVTEVPPERWSVDTYFSPDAGPDGVGRYTVSKWGGFIDAVLFDAVRYGIPPASLASIDPNQLLALEIANRALRDAGYAYDIPGADHSRTGVVFGAEGGSEMATAQTLRLVLPAYFGEVPEAMEELLPTITEDSFPGMLPNVIAGRVASRLDLGGPNFTIDAACASSLAAVDAACKELVLGASDLMVCGGVDLHNNINDYLMFTSAHALSPSGRSRTFDSSGDGIAIGEGVACVVLKRLADAERDGDRIYAVIKGVGGASDGRALGLTAPRPEGQRRALDRAYASAGLSPRQVGLVEAHGTGTVVGDRTELRTLTELFVDSGAEPGSTVLGSVKSQIGHTKCAAGMAGLIKAALAVYTGVKPPTIHMRQPNPAWDPRSSPFAFHTEASPWAAPAEERFAGVSGFGFGGTNFHVVLGAHAATADPRHAHQEWLAELFLFRGPDRAAAQHAIRKLLDRLERDPSVPLRRLAATAAREATARSGPVRVAVVAENRDELAMLLRRGLSGEHDSQRGLIQPAEAPAGGLGKVAFLFPGQGSQRPGALADLFVAFPELRHYLELGGEWADLLFPPTAFDEQTKRAQRDRIQDTRVAQPVLGIAGLAVDHVLRRLGVRPDMAGGHSYGELVALCVAGAFDPATLLELSRSRAEAIRTAAGDDPGTMAAVSGTAEQVRSVLAAAGLADRVTVANLNAPRQIVVSGPTDAVGRAVDALDGAGLSGRVIPVACAFHSPVVAAGVKMFAAALAERPVTAPRLPVWSNRTAAPYPLDADEVRAGLAAQIGAPVRFVEQIEAMYATGARVFVEAGPGNVLSGLVGQILGDRSHLTVTCDDRPGHGLRALLTAVAQLACAGVPVQTGWLFDGRDTAPSPAVAGRPTWLVDGQAVRDHNGNLLPGGMVPARRIKELSMAVSEPARNPDVRDARGDLVNEFLRNGREMLAMQRDVMLALLGGADAGRVLLQPTQAELPRHPAVEGDAVMSLASPGPVIQPIPAKLPAWPMPAPPVPSAPDSLPAPAPAPVFAPVPPGASVTAPVADGPGHSSAVAAPLAPDSPSAPVPELDVRGAVLTVISERTGYPEELLEPDLDLEADLSIDSIKRAEMAGEVVSLLRLPTNGDDADLEELVKARTVRSLVSSLEQRIAAAAAAPSSPAPPVAATPLAPAVAAAPGPAVAPDRPAGTTPRRMIVRAVPLAQPNESSADLAGARLLLTGANATTVALAARLREHGATLVQDEAGMARPDGLLLLDGLDDDPKPLLPEVVELLRTVLAGAPRWVLAVGPAAENARCDGMSGLFRTLAREYPDTTVRYVEVGTAASPNEIAGWLVDELAFTTTAPVVGRDVTGRRGEELTAVGLGRLADGGAGSAGDGAVEAHALGLHAESVVVLVGGARGITSRFARTLAATSGCRLELLGRTTMPTVPEDDETAAAADKVTLRAVLARRGARTPAEIDRAAQAILAAREVTQTVAELTALGAQVRYHEVDISDVEVTHQVLKRIHHEHGRIDGLVYGAGIVEDKLFADKTLASFTRVYGTKVDGAHAVLGALDAAGAAPRFVVLFGSIAAVYGSRGQADYAAANSALESVGTRWGRAGGRRCLTVHWGPWAPAGQHGGMVTPELVEEYRRRGVGLIDPSEGTHCLLRELAWGDPAVTSVVYTA